MRRRFSKRFREVKLEQIRFIRVDEVLKLHSRSLAKSGGQDGVRDQGLLESAVMAPQTGYYNSLAELTAVYAHGIVENHPFLDGNKRSGFVRAAVVLTPV